MSLTLKWNDADSNYEAAAGAKFTVEVRTKTGVAEVVTAAYNKTTQPGPQPKFTAVSAPKTLVVVYDATVEKARIELWEIGSAAGEEQLLTYRYHNPGASYLALQIN